MTDKQKSIFSLISKYVSSRGCEYLEIDVDPYEFTPYNGRNFGCGIDKSERQEKLPFDVSEIITEYINETGYSGFDEENLTGMSFKLYPENNTIKIMGTYQSVQDGPYSETERNEDNDGNLKKIIDNLKEKNIFPYAEVGFYGGGDSGYIEDFVLVGSDTITDFNMGSIPGLEDYLYDMLSANGGWENDEGSFGNFLIDSRAGTITLKFTWNEYAYEEEVFKEETF